MPQPIVLTGPPGPATDETFFAQVVEWCGDVRRATRLRYIVPTARRRMEVEEAVSRSCPAGKTMCGPRVETLDHFARRLFSASGQARLISWRAAAIAIEMLLATTPGNFPLLLGGRTIPFPGLVREVLRSIRELKRFAVGPDALLDAADGDTKAREVAELFRRYNAFLDAQNWADAQDALLVVGQRLSADAAFCQADVAHIAWIVFDGFVEFNPSEMPIVRALVARFETTFLLDSDPALPELFPSASPFDAHVEQRACTGPFAAIARIAVSDAQASVQTTAPRVQLIDGETREQEVERIASTIKTLLVEGAAQRDIAVVVPEVGQYTGLIEEIFPAHGLPYSLHHRASLFESPVTAAVLMLLQAPAHDFQRADLVGLLRSPFVRFEENGCALDAGAVEDLARAARIFRGKQAWLEGLRGQIAFRREHLGEPDYDRDEDESESTRRSPAEELRALESLHDPLTSALELLDELRTPRPVSAHSTALRRVIARFGIEHGALELTWTDPGLASHAQVLRELLGILDELELLDRTSRERRAVSLDGFVELLRSSAGAAHLATRPTLEGIEILDISRAAERRSRILFVAGLAEGSVPARVAHDALLGPSVRERAGLPSADRLAAFSQVDLYRAIASASESLVLCRPKLEDDRPLLKPMMLERIEQALDLTPRTPPSPPTSWRSVLCALGRHDTVYPPIEELLDHSEFAESPTLGSFIHCRDVERAREATPATATSYAGRLSTHLLDEVRRVYDRAHEFSYTELETYVRCPFRFLAKWLVRLAPVEEPEEEITAAKRGTLLHDIFRDFYAQWRSGTRGPITEQNRQEALALLTTAAQRCLDDQPYRGLVWDKLRDRLLGQAGGLYEQIPGLLHSFVDEEIRTTASSTACTPRFFELGFGRQRRARKLDEASTEKPLSITLGERRILLNGVIDRIDTNEEQGTFCVLDYKSGSTIPGKKKIEEGQSLQLPIYIMAASEILGEEYRFAAAGYFQTKDARDCAKKSFLGDVHLAPRAVSRHWRSSFTLDGRELDELLAREREIIGQAVLDIESGNFQVTRLSAEDAACRHCDYRHICRYGGITVRTFRGRT